MCCVTVHRTAGEISACYYRNMTGDLNIDVCNVRVGLVHVMWVYIYSTGVSSISVSSIGVLLYQHD